MRRGAGPAGKEWRFKLAPIPLPVLLHPLINKLAGDLAAVGNGRPTMKVPLFRGLARGPELTFAMATGNISDGARVGLQRPGTGLG